MLRTDLVTRDSYHNRFRHVMVDEFQDTNGIQYELIRLLVEGREYGNAQLPEDHWHNRSLCVVGDDGQSIYAFRGSDFKILLGYQKDYKNAKVVKLEENYRSTKHILDAANKIIANNKERIEKTLYTNSNEGAKIRYAQVYDGDAEARFVVSKIYRVIFAPTAADLERDEKLQQRIQLLGSWLEPRARPGSRWCAAPGRSAGHERRHPEATTG